MDISVKSELCQTKRHVCAVECERVAAPKSVKRRRRESRKEPQDGEQNQPAAATNAAGTTTVKRSSRFRGVSRHRWTGRYEAHLWDKGSWNPTQRKKGKQVYLGAYDEEESAARAYDLAALKYWGTSTFTNFPVPEYEKEVEIMKTLTKEEYLASLRRRSSGFSRGVSKYRGVARHHHNGRWEARIGRVFGNKYLYLGTYSTQEEAAHAYDIAAIEYRGIHAVTNFDLSTYIRWLRPVSTSLAAQQPKTFLIPSAEKPDSYTFGLNNDLNVAKPQEFLRQQATPGSPSALGLLLKSAVFRDLVEKNLSAESDTPTVEERSGYIECVNTLPELDYQDENTLPFCDTRAWNLPINPPPSSIYYN